MFEVGKYEHGPATLADYDSRAPKVAQLLIDAIQQRDARVAVDAIGFQKQSSHDPWPETRPMLVASVSPTSKNLFSPRSSRDLPAP